MVWKILTSALLDNDSCALLDLLFDPIVITSYSSVEELVHHYVQRLEILGCQAETGQSGVRLVRKELLLSRLLYHSAFWNLFRFYWWRSRKKFISDKNAILRCGKNCCFLLNRWHRSRLLNYPNLLFSHVPQRSIAWFRSLRLSCLRTWDGDLVKVLLLLWIDFGTGQTSSLSRKYFRDFLCILLSSSSLDLTHHSLIGVLLSKLIDLL